MFLPPPTPATTQSEMSEVSKDATIPNDLAGYVMRRFYRASTARRTNEQIWENSFRAYRGDYEPDEKQRMDQAEARNPGSSRVYIKVTKTKVLAAYGQLREILFNDNKFPIGLEPTDVPEGVADTVYIAPKGSPDTDPYGFPGDGNDLKPGDTAMSRLAGLASKYMPFLKGNELKDGPAPDKTKLLQLTPAEESARNMQKMIHDQLAETNATEALDKLALESVIYGTGIMKGPFNYIDTTHSYQQDPDTREIIYTPIPKLVPKLNQVSIWNFYPDPDAETMEDAEFAIEKHVLGRSGLKKLSRIPKMRKEAISKVLKMNPKRTREQWESTINDSSNALDDDRYDVYEYWGILDPELAREFEDDLDIDADDMETIQVNIWVCNGEVLRLVLNPYTPLRIPYLTVPYERHPHQIWGIGVPENMRDTQRLMNGHMRMSIDNLRLAGNVILEINENALMPGQDFSLYPGKIFRKNVGATGQSIFGVTIPNTSQSHMIMYDKARQLADEAVGIPSFSHGQTGVTGVGRTASGISMLMSAAAGAIKTVVLNFDEYLLEPLGEALFYWNMQFNEDKVDIRGDLRIVASGTKSLMQREVLTQRLITFMQVGSSNPATAPLINLQYIIQQIAISMGLDPDKVTNDLQKAQAYAQLLSMTNAASDPNSQNPNAVSTAQGPNSSSSGNSGGPASSGSVSGSIAPAVPTAPGETSFPGRT